MDNTKRLRNTFGWSAHAAKVAEEVFGQTLPDTALNELQIDDAGYAVSDDDYSTEQAASADNFKNAISHGEHNGYDYEDRELLSRHGGDVTLHPMPDVVLDRIENTIEINSVNGNDEENKELKTLLRALRAESETYKKAFTAAQTNIQDMADSIRRITPEQEFLVVLLNKAATPKGDIGAIFRSSESAEHPEKLLGRALTGIAYKNLSFKSDAKASHIYTRLVIDALKEARQMGAPELDMAMLQKSLNDAQSADPKE